MNSKPNFFSERKTQLHAAYIETTYEAYVEAETIQLHVGKSNSQLDQLLEKYHCNSWAFITAFNPYSQPLSALENNLRHLQLVEYLKPFSLKIFEGLGKDETGAWKPEKSLLVLGITRSLAISVGQKFSQNAIVYGELHQSPELQWVDSN